MCPVAPVASALAFAMAAACAGATKTPATGAISPNGCARLDECGAATTGPRSPDEAATPGSVIRVRGETTPGVSGVITGRTVDAVTGKPLVNIVVRAAQPELANEGWGLTGDDGAFRIEDLAPGDYSLSVQAYAVTCTARVHVGADVTPRVTAELAPSPPLPGCALLARTPRID
jgi:hypothetical protein